MKRLHRVLALAAGTAIAACGRANVPASVPMASFAERVLAPPQCKGQRPAPKYAQLKVKLTRRGASLCVPEFGGFGGTIEYPGVERPAELILRSSVENIYDQPQLGSGTAIFYLNLHFRAGTRFKTGSSSNGGLTSKHITAGQSYSAFGIVAVNHLVFMFPPCYTIATPGPYGGVLAGLGELFSGSIVTGAGYGVIEIYSGQQVSQPC